jgi:hypothetical protein
MGPMRSGAAICRNPADNNTDQNFSSFAPEKAPSRIIPSSSSLKSRFPQILIIDPQIFIFEIHIPILPIADIASLSRERIFVSSLE